MTGTTPPPTAGPRVTKEQVRDLRRLRRASNRPILGGVSEGLSRHLDIDPVLIRVIFGALTIFGGAGIVLYILAWLTIPADNAEQSWVSRTFRQDPERVMVLGLSLAAIVASLMLIGAIGFATPNPWAVITVSLLALVLFALFSRRSGPASPAPGGDAAPPIPADPATTDDGVTATDVPTPEADLETTDLSSTTSGTDTAVLPTAVTPEQRDAEVRSWWRRNSDSGGPSVPHPIVPGPPPRPGHQPAGLDSS